MPHSDSKFYHFLKKLEGIWVASFLKIYVKIATIWALLRGLTCQLGSEIVAYFKEACSRLGLILLRAILLTDKYQQIVTSLPHCTKLCQRYEIRNRFVSLKQRSRIGTGKTAHADYAEPLFRIWAFYDK